jgi:hypothetical protein
MVPVTVSIAVTFVLALSIPVECRQGPRCMAPQVLVPETRISQHRAAIFARDVLRKNHVAAAPVFDHADWNVPVFLGGGRQSHSAPYHRACHQDSLFHASQSPA